MLLLDDWFDDAEGECDDQTNVKKKTQQKEVGQESTQEWWILVTLLEGRGTTRCRDRMSLV